MRKLGLTLCGGLLMLPMLGEANAADGDFKAYYKEGTRLEFKDFDIKFNVQLQPRYEFEDYDNDGRDELGLEEEDNTSSFRLRRARLVVSGNALNKQFSYKLQNDFSSSSGGGEMKDAFLQWNGDPASIRFGQFKVPYTRQENISSSHLFFTDRSEVLGEYTAERDTGAMALGKIGELGNYYVGIFNGNSDGESDNRPGNDTKHNGAAAVDFALGDFGKRGEEGDFRKDGAPAGTLGASVIYGQGTGDPIGTGEDDFDQLRLNADAGIRVAGAEIAGEVFYKSTELDNVDGDAGEEENIGFYINGTYVMDQIGVGLRYGYQAPDDDVSPVDDAQEYAAVLNYFFDGHNLKLQNEARWQVINAAEGDEDVKDFTYILQLAGYF